MYKIKIPKILFLALDFARFYKGEFYNTNDLTSLANQYRKDLVRQRTDKIDHKYLDDTRFGGLRGNFSTLLTWRGFVKRGTQIVSRFSLGRDNRLVNAICKGEIILDKENLTANTNNKKLKELLEIESWLLNIREAQAHIKIMLSKRSGVPLIRDNDNFPKVSVVKTSKNQYFIRALVNNFIDNKNFILEYNIVNLWEGTKLKKKNLHLLIAIPTKKDAWDKIFAVKIEDLIKNKPLLLSVNLKEMACFDKDNNFYKLYTLERAIECFSGGNSNIKTRLNYSWKDLKEKECNKETDFKERKKDEFNVFLDEFLNWKKKFVIDGKKVVDIKVSSSGGPDVSLIYKGGVVQMLELEHNWKNYLDHNHHKDNVWRNSWIFAEENWEPKKVIKLFKPLKKIHHDRIPDVFLCIENGKRKAYRADWDNNNFRKMDLKF